ncbi:MAG: hypothetical protein KDC18_08535 [Alphaproteobacteria bacterium]|nr:hypothetical protein [Alphaproteobacteria bacterium]MCB9930304.1 hypothetical protein [Alphaproteobacteria bacterium]
MSALSPVFPTETAGPGHGPALGRGIALALAGLALIGMALAGGARAEGAYRPGHGYDLGPLNIAGYANVVASSQRNGPDEIVLDDLSLFVSGHFHRLVNPFIEAELADFRLVGNSSGDGSSELVLERLYNDANITDSLTLRLGLMLAPVGEWNEIHAAPLVLSSVRPAVTYRNFSEYVTGASVLYSPPLGDLPELQVYWQPGDELAERPDTLTSHHYNQVAGAHLAYPLGLLDKIGASLQRSTDEQGVDQTLVGIDYHYTLGNVTLQGEGTYAVLDKAPTGGRDEEWGLYAAARYKISDRWSVHAWYEAFADRNGATPAQDVLVGVGWRPLPAMIARVEYLQNVGGPGVNGTGVYASWSVLF